jgi:hypothetical protein
MQTSARNEFANRTHLSAEIKRTEHKCLVIGDSHSVFICIPLVVPTQLPSLNYVISRYYSQWSEFSQL